MATTTRKERERAERDRLILETARRMLLEDGYLGLTMDRIAGATEYSKGTIYQHYSCKEEVLAALMVQSMGTRCELFERAATFSGAPRERMHAVGFAAELFYRLSPDHVRAEQVVKAASIRDKTSEERQNVIRGMEQRCADLMTGIIRDGVARGDLALPEGVEPADVTVSLWALTMGFHALRASEVPFDQLGVRDMYATQRAAGNLLLDGLGWGPLSSEHDYDATLERLGREVFAPELQRLEEAAVRP
jgi:AcrR family transcriptional regulator